MPNLNKNRSKCECLQSVCEKLKLKQQSTQYHFNLESWRPYRKKKHKIYLRLVWKSGFFESMKSGFLSAFLEIRVQTERLCYGECSDVETRGMVEEGDRESGEEV